MLATNCTKMRLNRHNTKQQTTRVEKSYSNLRHQNISVDIIRLSYKINITYCELTVQCKVGAFTDWYIMSV